MFHSAEIRWYFESSLTDDIRDWFESAGKANREPARTDAYLLLPHCDTTSVKLRQGNLEVKANTRRPEPVTYANDVSGYRDAWVKWSCKATEVEALTTMLGANEARWAFVRKRRYLRKYGFDNGTPVEVNSVTENPERGCQVEITSIDVRVGELDAPPTTGDWSAADPWWSLSLEAFAPGATSVIADTMAHLDVVASHVFRDKPPCGLTAASSLSYPAWLLRVA